mgnify:CR=1 FL=1
MNTFLLCSALFCETTFNFEFKEESTKDKIKGFVKKYDLEWIVMINPNTEMVIDLEDIRVTVTHTY